jgi:hypothetical protein
MLRTSLGKEEESYGGGFDILVETSFGIQISDIPVQGLETVPLLTYGKEGGTCSNINAVFPPRLVGLPEEILEDNEFEVRAYKEGVEAGDVFGELEKFDEDRIPILVDENTLRWIYFGDVGTIFELEPLPGRKVKLEVVGILGPSVLTGTFVMSESALNEIYPSSSSRDLILVKGEVTDANIERIEEAYSDYGAEAIPVRDLARENLDYELSYLSLFRDFLIFGVLVAMAALVLFNHNRSVRFRKEMIIHRSLGVSRSRAITYILAENLAVLMISLSGSVFGALISIGLTAGMLDAGISWSGIVKGTAPVLMILILVSALSTFVSSWYSVIDYENQVPRGDA